MTCKGFTVFVLAAVIKFPISAGVADPKTQFFYFITRNLLPCLWRVRY